MAEKNLKDLTGAVVKIAENSPKIQKDVKDIRDAVCGTNGIIESLSLLNQSVDTLQKNKTLAGLKGNQKIDSKRLEKTHKNLIKNTDSIVLVLGKILKQIQKGGISGNIGKMDLSSPKGDKNDRLLKSIEVIERLRGIKLKDFLGVKTKMKHIESIMTKSLNMFRMFKNNKEVENTISFINSSIEIMKKLAKVSILSKPAQWGAKAIEKIFFGSKGNGGLLKVFQRLDRNERVIKKGKKTITRIVAACTSMLIASIMLAGIAVISPLAFLGALAMKGLVWLMVGTFKFLGKSMKSVAKGAITLVIMSAGIITFSLGLGLLTKVTRNMKLKDVGIMLASIVGVGLAVAGIGLLAIPIAIGSGVLLLIGASLGILGLALYAWQNLDSKKVMGNIETAIGGLRDVFGLELGKGDDSKTTGQRLGGALIDIAMSVLQFGKTFFVMGSLLLAGAALGMLYLGLKPWENYTGAKKAAANIKVAIDTLKEVFGLETPEDNGSKLKALAGGLLDTALGLLQMGKTFIMMGTLVLATAMMDIIRVTLIPWENYTGAKKAAGNMKIAIGALKETFGLETPEDNGSKFKALGGALLDMGLGLLQMGKTFITMGTLVIATAMMDVIRLTLIPWDNYDASKAVGNMKTAITGLKECFGLDDDKKDVKEFGGGFLSDLLGLGSSLMKMGETFFTMGTLLIATGAMEKIQENLTAWDNYDSSKAISNIKKAIYGLTDAFGLQEEPKEEPKESGFWGKVGGFFSRAADSITAPVKMVGNLFSAAEGLTEGGKLFAKLSTLVSGSASMLSIKTSIEPWDKFDGKTAISNIKNIIYNLENILYTGNSLYDTSWMFRKMSLNFNSGMRILKKSFIGTHNLSSLVKALSDPKIATPINSAVKSINSLDMEKATVIRDIFKTFSRISLNKPFDKFTESVDKFVDACNDMVDSIDRLGNVGSSSTIETTSENEEATSTQVSTSGGVNINNTKQLADAIAQALRSLNIRLNPSMLDINLIAEGGSGKTVKLTLQD